MQKKIYLGKGCLWVMLIPTLLIIILSLVFAIIYGALSGVYCFLVLIISIPCLLFITYRYGLFMFFIADDVGMRYVNMKKTDRFIEWNEIKEIGFIGKNKGVIGGSNYVFFASGEIYKTPAENFAKNFCVTKKLCKEILPQLEKIKAYQNNEELKNFIRGQ